MKKIITVLLMMAVLMCGCGEGKKQETQKEVSNLYEMEELVTVELDDVEFKIPKKWEESKKESGNNTYYYSDGMMVMIQTSESYFYDLDTLSEDEKEEAKEDIISGMKEGAEYEELSGNFEEVSGITSIRIKGNGTISGKEGNQDSLIFAQNGVFYNFSIFVYKESNLDYEEDFKKLLESIKVSDGKVIDTENNSTENQNSMYFSKMPDSEENIMKNIEITSDKTEDGKIVVFVTNRNEYAIPDLEIQVLFKKGEEIVDTGEDGHDVLVPENTVVSKIDAPMDYENYEINATIEWGYEAIYRNWIYNLNVSSNIGEDGVVIQFENIGDIDIEELEYIVVYYKDEKIQECSYAEDVYDLKAGDKIIEKSDVYGTKFDKYEVYINQAHTFDEKYTNSEPIKETLPDSIGKRTMESSNEEKINDAEESNENEKSKEENSESIILSYDKEGEYGQYDLFDGEPYLRYYVPIGNYKVKCKIQGGFYIESIEKHKEDGFETTDVIRQIDMSEGEEVEISIEEGQCIFLYINTEIELIKK